MMDRNTAYTPSGDPYLPVYNQVGRLIDEETNSNDLTQKVSEYIITHLHDEKFQEIATNAYVKCLSERHISPREVDGRLSALHERINQDRSNVLSIKGLDDEQAFKTIQKWVENHEDPLTIALDNRVVHVEKSWIRNLDIPKRLLFDNRNIPMTEMYLTLPEKLALIATCGYFRSLFSLKEQSIFNNIDLNINNITNTEFQYFLQAILNPSQRDSAIAVLFPHLKDLNLNDFSQGDDHPISKLKTLEGYDAEKLSLLMPIFGIDPTTRQGKQALFETAKLVAQISGSNISKYIENYGMDAQTDQGQQALIEIAKLAAQQKDSRISEYIINYKIDTNKEQGRKALYEIAKFAAEQGEFGISKIFIKYSIDDSTPEGQQALIEIAKIVARQNGCKISLFIKNFRINEKTEQGQKALIEIALLAAEHDSEHISKYIKNYNINNQTEQGQQALIKIAKIVAQRQYSAISEYITNYGIDKKTKEGQQTLIEIAKLAAHENAHEVNRFIQNYGIDSEEARIEIAKIAARKSYFGISDDIQNYGINAKEKQGLQALIEIAKIAIQQSVSDVSENIQNYGFDANDEQGLQALIEIAKTAAKKDGAEVSKNIKNFGFNPQSEQGQKTLTEIAELAACQNGMDTCSYIENYGITNVDALRRIFLFALQNNLDSISHIDTYPLEIQNVSELFNAVNGFKSNQIGQDFYLLLNKFWPWIKIKSIDEDDLGGFEELRLLLALSATCWLLKVPPDVVSEEVKALVELRNPLLRKTIGQSIIYILLKTYNHETITTFKSKYKDVPALPRIYLFMLQEEGAPPEKIEEISRLIQKTRLFKDQRKFQMLLQTLDVLVNESFGAEKKAKLLELVLTSAINNKSVNDLRIIPGINGLDKNLDRLKDVDTSEDINRAFMKAFQSKAPFGDVENFFEKFQDSFGTFRDDTALLTYAGSIGKLPEASRSLLFEKLGTFIQSVVEGTFLTDRYTSDHLNTVFSDNHELKQKWQRGAERPLEDVQESPSKESIDFKALIERSINEGHVAGNYVEHVITFLQTKNQQSLIQSLKDKTISKDERERLSFQKNLISIATATTKADALARLKLCLEKLPPNLNNKQIRRDLEGWIQGLEQGDSDSAKTSGWILKDSDDPCDLLLSGTEVAGSCQNVVGDPHFNKCLLAYLLDGKNRLLAIKNENGVIKARSVLRILWDGQQPVLFMERTYPALLDQKLKDQLLDFAKERAKALGLPLLSKECGTGNLYNKEIRSLGGRAPFEYVDADNGVKENSIWSIQGAHVIDTSDL